MSDAFLAVKDANGQITFEPTVQTASLVVMKVSSSADNETVAVSHDPVEVYAFIENGRTYEVAFTQSSANEDEYKIKVYGLDELTLHNSYTKTYYLRKTDRTDEHLNNIPVNETYAQAAVASDIDPRYDYYRPSISNQSIYANGNLINGAVKFYEGSTLLGTVNTTNGVAQYTVSNASITTHTYHAVFEQTTDYHEATSSNVTVNVTKDTPKLSKLTGDLYSGWVTACQLTNSKGTALSSKTVSIKISTNNSTWSTYNKNTNSSGKASQTITGSAQKIYVQYVFAGDSQYNAVTLTGTFNILSPKSVKKAAGTIVSNPASDSGSYRKWYDTYTDGDDNPIRAGNTCNSAPIAGKNGTHNRPAAIVKSGWGFNIPTGATITKIVCAWKSKQGECGNAYPSIPAGTVTLKVGSLTLTGTGSKGGNGSYVSSSKTWSSPNVSAANVNSSSMKLTLSHAANTNSNPGLFYVIGPTLTVYYNPAQGSV